MPIHDVALDAVRGAPDVPDDSRRDSGSCRRSLERCQLAVVVCDHEIAHPAVDDLDRFVDPRRRADLVVKVSQRETNDVCSG